MKQRELWTELIGAMQELVGANVLAQDLHPVLVRVRSSMSELADRVTGKYYQRLDRWMTVEHQVINGLLERTVVQLEGEGHSIQQIEDAHRASNECVSRRLTWLDFRRAIWHARPSPR